MIVASICGGIIGFERSRRRKEAGLRTHIIVALGSAL
ncbi:MAG: MgtC/SapB family protein, partial [Anaerotignum sp.]